MPYILDQQLVKDTPVRPQHSQALQAAAVHVSEPGQQGAKRSLPVGEPSEPDAKR